jgi:5-methylcytosine-specific restriction endonuclease McrA
MAALPQSTTVEFFAPLKRRAEYSMKVSKKGKTFFSYEHYREHFQNEIAEQCVYRCVYCDSHESEVGGRESMELDHFRPWSLPAFAHLKNDPANLHHACGRCNRLKSSRWPSTKVNEPHDNLLGFIDPFLDDRRHYFGVNNDGSLACKQHPATYMVRLLELNRPLLRLLRLRRILRHEIAAYIAKMLPEINAVKAGGGSLTREQLAEAWLKLEEYHRLIELCDAPLNRLRAILATTQASS